MLVNRTVLRSYFLNYPYNVNTIYIINGLFFLRNINNYAIIFVFFFLIMSCIWDFLFFASPSSKNQKVLFLSSKIRHTHKKKKKKKKERTDTKASGNYQNACKPLNLKVFIQYREKK
jgi:hypothetical protein